MRFIKQITLFIFLVCGIAFTANAQNKGRVVNPNTDIYSAADFDSVILGTIDPDTPFLVSKKLYGAFYKIKLKDGTIGFIPDVDLYIEGQGTVKPRAFRGDEDLKTEPFSDTVSAPDHEEIDTENPRLSLHGMTLQLINFRESTMGGQQLSDLVAYGYRFQPLEGNFQSVIAYDLFIAPETPAYYADKTGGQISGGSIWGTAGVSNVTDLGSKISIRYGAGPFLRYSQFNVRQAPLKPQSSYTLQELTAGLDFQAGVMFHLRWVTVDLGLRYFWDKESYGGFGVGFLF